MKLSPFPVWQISKSLLHRSGQSIYRCWQPDILPCCWWWWSLLFLSAVRVGECRLFEPRTSSNGKTQKILEGALIEGEWERLVGAVVISLTRLSTELRSKLVICHFQQLSHPAPPVIGPNIYYTLWQYLYFVSRLIPSWFATP